LVLVVVQGACGGGGASEGMDASADAGTDGQVSDASTAGDGGEGVMDAGHPEDAGPPEAGADATQPDASLDAGSDAGTDGGSPAVGGWAIALGGLGVDTAAAVAVDATGNIFVTGQFSGTVDFGDGPLSSAGSTDIFVVSLDAEGNTRWATRFGGTGTDHGSGIAVDTSGHVLVTGFFGATVDFGGGPITSTGGLDGFALSLEPDGTARWATTVGGTGSDRCYGIAVDDAGNATVVGWFEGSTTASGLMLTGAGAHDAFILNLDSNGAFRWARSFGQSNNDLAAAVTTNGDGDVLVTGYFQGAIDAGGGSISSAGGSDIFVVGYDQDGNYRWGQALGGSGTDSGWGIGADGDGNVVVTGSFSDMVDFGGGALTTTGTTADIFVLSLSPTATFRWARGLGSVLYPVSGLAITTDPAGHVWVTGRSRDTASLDGVTLSGGAFDNIFVLELDGTGSAIWGQVFGSNGAESGASIASNSSGHIYVTGRFENPVDFGYGLLRSDGRSDAFVLKLVP
jgi:hypothetical protein